MKKPFLHAFGAALYIVTIVFSINRMSRILPEDNILMPMTALSLFVLSAAIMGFLFLSEPFYLFMDNRKKEAVNFFGQTVAIFACFVALFAILIFVF